MLSAEWVEAAKEHDVSDFFIQIWDRMCSGAMIKMIFPGSCPHCLGFLDTGMAAIM